MVIIWTNICRLICPSICRQGILAQIPLFWGNKSIASFLWRPSWSWRHCYTLMHQHIIMHIRYLAPAGYNTGYLLSCWTNLLNIKALFPRSKCNWLHTVYSRKCFNAIIFIPCETFLFPTRYHLIVRENQKLCHFETTLIVCHAHLSPVGGLTWVVLLIHYWPKWLSHTYVISIFYFLQLKFILVE